MILRNRPVVVLGVVVLSAVAVFSIHKTVQAHRGGGRDQAVREAEEQLRLGTTPAEGQPEAPQPDLADTPDTGENFNILNADKFHTKITDIDRLVFDAQPIDDARRARLASRLEQLATRVKSASDTRFIEIETFELRQLATYAASAPRAFLENHWMRIRNNVFDDRSWFARSADDLEPLPSPETAADPFKPPVPSDEPKETPRRGLAPAPVLTTHDLEGRWRVRELYGNGRLTTDPELSDSVWTFRGDQLSIESPSKAPDTYTFERVEDSQGNALRLESNGSNSGPAERGWMNYEFGDRVLTLAFYDGLGARPEGFTLPPGKTEPMFTVVTLQRDR